MTVWTPHHDSVTAAPVASDHASTCTSPLRIAAILHHEHHGCLPALPRSGMSPAEWAGIVHNCLMSVVHRRRTATPGWRTVPPMASVLVVEDDQFVRSALIR